MGRGARHFAVRGLSRRFIVLLVMYPIAIGVVAVSMLVVTVLTY
jgi:hypothetical protein